MSAWVYLDWSGGVHVCCKWRVENVNLFSSSKKEKLVLVPKSHVGMWYTVDRGHHRCIFKGI